MNGKKLLLISAIGLLLLPGYNFSMDISVPKVADRQLNPQLTEARFTPDMFGRRSLAHFRYNTPTDCKHGNGDAE
ncbi:MAG: hypothetical protein GDA56_08255 [Hormoscilla sp. GM7CHS1pb]|nr:hypothetical protein [Hormoscilla sp. GM7CHS1pb]